MTDKEYIYFGHGWDMNETFNLSIYENVTVIALKHGCLFVDDSQDATDHVKMIQESDTVTDYYTSLLEYAIGSGRNKLCVYSSDDYYIIPNMILTTYKKNYGRELTGLYDLQQKTKREDTIHVETLEELINRLGSRNLTLTVIACRGPLDQMNYDELRGSAFVDDNNEIIKYMMSKKMQIVSTHPTEGQCKSFYDFLKIDYTEDLENDIMNKYNAKVDLYNAQNIKEPTQEDNIFFSTLTRQTEEQREIRAAIYREKERVKRERLEREQLERERMEMEDGADIEESKV